VSCRAHEEAIEQERRARYHTATWHRGWFGGRRDRFLEDLRVVTGCLMLGERVLVLSSTREAMWKIRERYRQSQLFKLLKVRRELNDGALNRTTYELECGGVLMFQVWTPRPESLRGYEGQVIFEELPAP
jgi:hypothetical protein